MKQVFSCVIRTKAPVHVGCDEVYEPTGFVVDEARNTLVVFDPITFISQMTETDRNRFSEICGRGTIASILEIYKFLKNRNAHGRSVQLCSGFVAHYNKTLSISINDKKRIQQELGRFAVSRTAFLASDNRPYIPGSSVKGTLRTAFLNLLAKKASVPTPRGKQAARELEKKLLDYDQIQTDPFRLVKVSDFMPVGNAQTRVVYAVNVKKASGTAARGPFQIIEAVVPGTEFRGSIAVETPLDRKVVNRPVELDALLASCRSFYAGEFRREHKELANIGASLTGSLFSKEGIPVRIGRHSGAESVTIEGHRQIKIMAGKGKRDTRKDHATTLWLASEESNPRVIKVLQPFGWCELLEVEASLEREIEDREAAWVESESAAAGSVFKGSTDRVSGKTEAPLPQKTGPEPETWENVTLNYAKNTGELSAKYDGKTATTRDKSIIPDAILKRLTKKRGKTVTATIKAEHIGGRNYRIIEIG